MTEEFLNGCYQDLLGQLEENKVKVTRPLAGVTAALSLIKSAVSRVREELVAGTFESESEEIVFYKSWMVKYYALFVYELERFRIADALPKGAGKVLMRYYERQLKGFGLYFSEHAFWYGYYRNELELFDRALFLGNAADELFLPESPDFFGSGFPACTYIFARFMAYERLISELNLKLHPVVAGEEGKTYTHGLQWTGNKVNVAELAYGLYYAGQFNHGNAEVIDIYKWLEESLGISMGSIHRKFIDLRRRNTASPTKLLDKMRESIHQRIDEDLRYKPNRGIKLNRSLDAD